MRGFNDIPAGFRPAGVRAAKPAAEMRIDRDELSRASLPHLCPGAFDGFAAYEPASEPPAELCSPQRREAAAPR